MNNVYLNLNLNLNLNLYLNLTQKSGFYRNKTTIPRKGLSWLLLMYSGISNSTL